MRKGHRNIIHVECDATPVVELDSAAHAAYIRFSNAKVSRTEVIDVNRCLVTMDVSEDGKIVGVELAGVAEFGLNSLLKKAGVRGVSAQSVRNARYVAANPEPVLA